MPICSRSAEIDEQGWDMWSLVGDSLSNCGVMVVFLESEQDRKRALVDRNSAALNIG